ncbi:hypothetical protein LXT23_38015 [Pyxidicoccus sp. QH1ED-7-1]|nr:hypothetical protein [Pyxidicoccus xibeiensis]
MTLGLVLIGRMESRYALGYVVAQCLGAVHCNGRAPPGFD